MDFFQKEPNALKRRSFVKEAFGIEVLLVMAMALLLFDIIMKGFNSLSIIQPHLSK